MGDRDVCFSDDDTQTPAFQVFLFVCVFGFKFNKSKFIFETNVPPQTVPGILRTRENAPQQVNKI